MKGAEKAALKLLARLLEAEERNYVRAARNWRKEVPGEDMDAERIAYEAAHADGMATGTKAALNLLREVTSDLTEEASA